MLTYIYLISDLYESLAYIETGKKQHSLGREKEERRNYVGSCNSDKESRKWLCLQFAVKYIILSSLWNIFATERKNIFAFDQVFDTFLKEHSNLTFFLLGMSERSTHICKDPSSYWGFRVGEKIPRAKCSLLIIYCPFFFPQIHFSTKYSYLWLSKF